LVVVGRGSGPAGSEAQRSGRSQYVQL
jgi:hypothetical protein